MNRIKYSIICLAMAWAFSGCFKEYEQRYIFTFTMVEFDDATNNANASGKDYPMLTPLDKNSGVQLYRVNLIGPQADTPTVIHFMPMPDVTTAVLGQDYALPQGDTIIIPAGSSFGYIKVEVLPTGGGNPTVGLELLGNANIKAAERYCRVGFQIMFPVTLPDPSTVTRMNDITYYTDITLGSYNNQNVGGAFDLKTGGAYSITSAADATEHIDMLLLRSSSTEMNLMVPANSGVTAWGSSKHIPDEWATRNNGTMVRLPNPSEYEVNLFENAETVQDIQDAFDEMEVEVKNRPGYSSTNDGPSGRVRSIGTGDIILFKSASRDVIAIMKVGEIVPGAAGSMQLQVKTGPSN